MNIRICDVCGDEITEKARIGSSTVEVIGDNCYDICPKCSITVSIGVKKIQDKLVKDIYRLVEKSEHEINKMFTAKISTRVAKELGGMPVPEVNRSSEEKKAVFVKALSMFFGPPYLSALDQD